VPLATIAAAAFFAQASLPPGIWRHDAQEAACLATLPSGVEISKVPNSDVVSLTVIGPSAALVSAAASGPLEILLDSPTLRIRDAAFGFYQERGQTRLSVFGLPADVLQRIASSGALRLSRGGGPVLAEFELGAVADAVAGLSRCEEMRLREWGFDLDALRSLRQRPAPVSGPWLTFADYPASSVIAREEGSVVARLDIDARGRVTHCAVVVGSGHASLDRTTCLLYRKRARFRPAVGPDGAPTPSQTIFRAVWRIP
jgi:TonB family protein